MASLFEGDWDIDANSFTGILTLHLDATGNLINSSVFGGQIGGFWDDAASKLTFIRPIGTNFIDNQIYIGYAWVDGDGLTHRLAGSFVAFQGTGGTAAHSEFGWQASVTFIP